MAVQVIAVLLMVFGIMPRELSIVVTGIVLFYIIFSPLKESLWILIASIPFYVALPLTLGFDTLANWRILVIALFLVLFFRQGISTVIKKSKHGRVKKIFKYYQVEYLVGIIIVLAFLSLVAADNVWLGLKKIIFLTNVFFIYIIARNVCRRDKQARNKVISALKFAGYTILSIGFVQLVVVYFYRLHEFWHFWDSHVISVFYGQDLSHLLSYSNTWFSYYDRQLPTLRMFSIFPDSHSFAILMMLLLPFTMAFVYGNKRKEKHIKAGLWLLLVFNLIAIIFSGSRGAWVSVGLAMITFIMLAGLKHIRFVSRLSSFFIVAKRKTWQEQMQLIIGSLLIFIILFPIASAILFVPQYIQLDQDNLTNLNFFERSASIFNFNELSVKSRLEIWTKTFDSMIVHPLLGVGIGNYPTVLNEELHFAKMGSSAHSLYLEFAAEMGVFAAIVLIVIFWKLFKRGYRILTDKIKLADRKVHVWAGFFTLAIVMVIGYSIFDVVLLNDKVLLFFASALGVYYTNGKIIKLN